MARPFVSAIIPAYQAATTIAESLASVLAQSPEPDEVIVVDDGSTDGTGDIVRDGFPSVTLVCQPNRGAAAALNVAVARARGEIIAVNDADDIWTPRRLEMQMAAWQREPDIDGVGGHVEHFVCPSVPTEEAHRFVIPEGPQPSILVTSLIVRREAFASVGPFAEDLSTSYSLDWSARARDAGLRFRILPDIVLRRRVRIGSLSARSRPRDLSYLDMARRAIERRRATGTGL